MSRRSIPPIAMVCFLISAPLRAQLVTNGGFETGTTAGWTLLSPCVLSGVSAMGHSGNFGFYSSEVGTTCAISQTIATTAGSQYTFSFWVANGAGTINSIDARWNGSSVYSLVNNGESAFQQKSFTVMATGSSTIIRFEFRHDPALYFLDDVQVVAAASTVPEPSTYALMAAGLLAITLMRRKPGARAR